MTEQSNEWWVAVTHAFSAHVREERAILEEYEKLASTTADAGTRFLIQLIVADERRHHELFERLGSDAFYGVHELVPDPPDPPADEVPDLLSATRRFIEVEREDAEHLSALRRQLRPVRDETLWRLLVELMQLDTEKHLRILSYLEDRLNARR
jgi:hypothetical protein